MSKLYVNVDAYIHEVESGVWCVDGDMRQATTADLVAALREEGGHEVGVWLSKMLHRFNPPSDMAVNEKVAYKEGVHWAFDYLMGEIGSDLVVRTGEEKTA